MRPALPVAEQLLLGLALALVVAACVWGFFVVSRGRVSEEYRAYREISRSLHKHWSEQAGAEFGSALGNLREMAQSGCVEAAARFAEVLALPGPRYDAAEAYRWYCVAYAAEGYEIGFDNLAAEPPYHGRDGDFRNESMVSALVETLGLDRVRAIDAEVAAWLRTHELRFISPWDERTTRS